MLHLLFASKVYRTTWIIPLASLALGVLLGTSQVIVADDIEDTTERVRPLMSDSVSEVVSMVCVDEDDLIVADINNDGAVGVDDLIVLLSNYGVISETAADINNDHIVDVSDLVEVVTRLK